MIANRHKHLYTATAAFGLLSLVCSCNSTRHVPEGEYLLDKVTLRIEKESAPDVSKEALEAYVRQQPNHKLLWKGRFRLGIYNLSGSDSTKWYNRLARNLGEAPVIYDSTLTTQSAQQLCRALVNLGYLHASVEADTTLDNTRRRATVAYDIIAGKRYEVADINYNIPDDTLRNAILADSLRFPLKVGAPLDRNVLDEQRTLITDRLRNHGYYSFSRDFITFVADTSAGSTAVDLTMKVEVPAGIVMQAEERRRPDRIWRVRNVAVVTDYDAATYSQENSSISSDTVTYRDINIIYDASNRYLRESVIYENCYVAPGKVWSARSVDRTYEAFSRLGILKFINVRTVPIAEIDGEQWVDVTILLTPGKSQTLSLSLEGTNSEGDLGVAASIGYTHRNIGRGSETFTAKFSGAYESLSGNLEGFIHNRYMEYGVDGTLTFPKFKFPLLSDSFKRKIRASTEFRASLNYQERPEYTRVVANMGWAYKWAERRKLTRHLFTLVDVDYVYLPESTIDFIDDIAPNNPLLRYSYEDHFIMRLGYSFYHSNKRVSNSSRGNVTIFQPSLYTIRINSEIAGNLLFAISSIFAHRSNFHSDPYKVFGIHYAQYFKVDGDYTFVRFFDTRNSLAFRAGAGIIVPYGNSTVAPFEKRFYGGGANGVRGWDVRTLGPGAFHATNSVTDFINQCGDINLILSAEFRSKLFWVVELGAFVDAGNIWTLHNYENQPGGIFHFKTFYKELAAAYGLGIRLDFNYFLLRFDLGMKAHNPAFGQEKWPLIHPRWGRDSSFHFSIGYPF